MARALVLAFVAAAAIVPAGCSTAGLQDAYMALDPGGFRRRTTFFTDTENIYCVAEVASGRDDLSIEALIRQRSRYDYAQRKFVESDIVHVVADEAPGRGDNNRAQFQLLRAGPTGEATDDGPYPVGTFACEIKLDGALVRALDFNVDFPTCPEARIQNLSGCLGYYPAGKVCPASGASSGDPRTCACDEATRLWQCQ